MKINYNIKTEITRERLIKYLESQGFKWSHNEGEDGDIYRHEHCLLRVQEGSFRIMFKPDLYFSEITLEGVKTYLNKNI